MDPVTDWQRPPRCGARESCGEIADGPDGAKLVRDGKDPDGPWLTFAAADWESLRCDHLDRVLHALLSRLRDRTTSGFRG